MNVRGTRTVAFALLAFALILGMQSISEGRAESPLDLSVAHCESGTTSGAFDLAYDTSDDTLWVIDQGAGTICHYSLQPFPPEMQEIAGGPISHPFGPATFPLLQPVCRGVTYNPVFDTLIVLNSSTSEIQQIDKLTGAGAGAAVPLAPSGAPGTFHGLAYDVADDTVWARDVANNVLREFDPLSGVEISVLPIPTPVGDVFFGDSLHHGGSFLELSYGDIFSGGVTRTIRLDDTTGAVLGVEVDLTLIPGQVLGTVRSPGGSAFYATTSDQVHKITCPAPAEIAPTALQGRADNNGNITLTWNNHGSFAGGDYAEIEVVRDGTVLLTAAPGSTNTYFDTTNPDGLIVTYTINATTSTAAILSTSVDVRTGAGALVDHTQFDGASIFDIAYNEVSGNLLVSELTAGGVNGTIYEYDTDLNLVGTIPTTLSQVRGIAYNSLIDEIVVTRVGSPNITRIDPLTGTVIASFSTPISNLGCLSYDPILNAYLVQDLDSGEVRALNATVGASPPVLGQTLWTCSPPLTTGLNFAAGIAVLPGDLLAPEGYFMAPVYNAGNLTVQANQFTMTNCFPTTFDVPFVSLGSTVTQEVDAIRGLEDVGNILFVCNESTNTLFKMLLAPGGNNFIRGDANQDLVVDAADIMFIADYLYSGGSEPVCFDAVDANDDGRADLSDAFYLIFYLFQPTGLPSLPFPDPPAPFPTEGPDPTFVDALGC